MIRFFLCLCISVSIFSQSNGYLGNPSGNFGTPGSSSIGNGSGAMGTKRLGSPGTQYGTPGSGMGISHPAPTPHIPFPSPQTEKKPKTSHGLN